MIRIPVPSGKAFVLAPPDALDYFDTQSTPLAREMTALEAWTCAMSREQPLLKLAFRIRDAISRLFGVRRIGGFTRQPRERVAVGDHLDFFLVEHAEPQVLVLTERDRHLDVLTCISTEGQRFTITSSVKVHNLFGRAYMIPVGVAHRWIVRDVLRWMDRRAGPARPG